MAATSVAEQLPLNRFKGITTADDVFNVQECLIMIKNLFKDLGAKMLDIKLSDGTTVRITKKDLDVLEKDCKDANRALHKKPKGNGKKNSSIGFDNPRYFKPNVANFVTKAGAFNELIKPQDGGSGPLDQLINENISAHRMVSDLLQAYTNPQPGRCSLRYYSTRNINMIGAYIRSYEDVNGVELPRDGGGIIECFYDGKQPIGFSEKEVVNALRLVGIDENTNIRAEFTYEDFEIGPEEGEDKIEFEIGEVDGELLNKCVKVTPKLGAKGKVIGYEVAKDETVGHEFPREVTKLVHTLDKDDKVVGYRVAKIEMVDHKLSNKNVKIVSKLDKNGDPCKDENGKLIKYEAVKVINGQYVGADKLMWEVFGDVFNILVKEIPKKGKDGSEGRQFSPDNLAISDFAKITAHCYDDTKDRDEFKLPNPKHYSEIVIFSPEIENFKELFDKGKKAAKLTKRLKDHQRILEGLKEAAAAINYETLRQKLYEADPLNNCDAVNYRLALTNAQIKFKLFKHCLVYGC